MRRLSAQYVLAADHPPLLTHTRRIASRASAEVAPFPFTTLMPNLGAMTMPNAPPPAAPSGAPRSAAAESAARRGRAVPTVLADLPGLVEGAHAGKGLGRVFLRHLRRVRVVLYVLDASNEPSAPPSADTSSSSPSADGADDGADNGVSDDRDGPRDAAAQYAALRRELQLYNPQYLERPHVVALNKLDVPLADGGDEALARCRRAHARAIAQSAQAARELTAPPVAIVPISGLKGKGLRILKEALNDALAHSQQSDDEDDAR
jgi:GTPase involved in cell partitioning and DNA repair